MCRRRGRSLNGTESQTPVGSRPLCRLTLQRDWELVPRDSDGSIATLAKLIRYSISTCKPIADGDRMVATSVILKESLSVIDYREASQMISYYHKHLVKPTTSDRSKLHCSGRYLRGWLFIHLRVPFWPSFCDKSTKGIIASHGQASFYLVSYRANCRVDAAPVAWLRCPGPRNHAPNDHSCFHVG